jgi:hypothetical protein
MVHYSRVINGLITYVNNELAAAFNGSWEAWIIRTFAGLAGNKADKLFRALADNNIIKALDLIDGENVNIELFMPEFKRQAQQNAATIKLPVIGPVTFTAADVDALHRYIMGG